MMFPYDLPFLPGSRPPERWDVVVFRYPEEPEVSYIKRLVGLPGETIRIFHGDVYIKRREARHSGWHVSRSCINRAMQINVYDDRHRPRALSDRPEWQRWRSEAGGWTTRRPVVESLPVQSTTPKDEWAELRYRHLVPDPEQWEAILNDQASPRPPCATLVTDFYSYNTNMSADYSNLLDEVRRDQEGAWMQPHWVGDLTLELNLEIVSSSSGRIGAVGADQGGGCPSLHDRPCVRDGRRDSRRR